MQKTTFKIATKFERKHRLDDLTPTEYQEVEGFVIGNWGITDYWDKGKTWTVYHTLKGLRLSHYHLEFDNALIALKKAVEMFGENHNGEPTSENHKLLNKWEWECFDLLPPDGDD